MTQRGGARMAAGRVEFVGSSCLCQLLRDSFSANVDGSVIQASHTGLLLCITI